MNKGLCPIVKCRQKQRAVTGRFRNILVQADIGGCGFALHGRFRIFAVNLPYKTAN